MFNFMMYGAGRISSATSVRMLGMEMPKRNDCELTLHEALMLLSQ